MTTGKMLTIRILCSIAMLVWGFAVLASVLTLLFGQASITVAIEAIVGLTVVLWALWVLNHTR